MTKERIEDIFIAILVWWPLGVYALFALPQIYFDPESEYNLQIERIAKYDSTAAGLMESEKYMSFFVISIAFFILIPIFCVTVVLPAMRKFHQAREWFYK